MNTLRVWWWKWRLGHALAYEANLQDTIDRERARAERDVRFCEFEVARAERAMMEAKFTRIFRRRAG